MLKSIIFVLIEKCFSIISLCLGLANYLRQMLAKNLRHWHRFAIK
jgi:hypothetical protein